MSLGELTTNSLAHFMRNVNTHYALQNLKMRKQIPMGNGRGRLHQPTIPRLADLDRNALREVMDNWDTEEDATRLSDFLHTWMRKERDKNGRFWYWRRCDQKR